MNAREKVHGITSYGLGYLAQFLAGGASFTTFLFDMLSSPRGDGNVGRPASIPDDKRRSAMARKVVTQYAVFHNIGANSDVVFYYQGGGADSVTGIPFTEAAYIVDLLRHEKPMSYDATLKRLSTYSLEPVGEGE